MGPWLLGRYSSLILFTRRRGGKLCEAGRWGNGRSGLSAASLPQRRQLPLQISKLWVLPGRTIDKNPTKPSVSNQERGRQVVTVRLLPWPTHSLPVENLPDV